MEPNPQFTISRKLRPCRVTKNLLLDLERSISATLVDIAGDGDRVRKKIRLSITDADGEEVLASAEQISGDQFPNSTKEVRLEMSVTLDSAESPAVLLTARLSFNARNVATLRIILQCPRARDQAVGLERRVVRLMDNAFDNSRFFHPPESLLDFLGVICAFGGLLWLIITVPALWEGDIAKFSSDEYVSWSGALLGLLFYVIVCARYFPECAFESKRRAELDDQKAWAKKAVWSLIAINFLIFTIGSAVVLKVRSYLGL